MRAWEHQITNERLDAFRRHPDDVSRFVQRLLASSWGDGEFSDPRWTVYLDKSWDLLSYLLRSSQVGGTALANDPVQGGTEIGAPLDYGPARYFTPGQVKELAQALQSISWEALVTHLDPGAMSRAGIYLAGVPGVLEDARPAFHQLVNFYVDAAANNHAILAFVV